MSNHLLIKVQRSLDAIESGRWSELSLSECADKIAWLAKWKKVPESDWVPVCERITALLDQGFE